MAVQLPNGRNYFATATGAPAVGYRLYAFVPGTSTPKDTYTTSAGNVANPHPVVADARGEMTIYWDGSYDVVLRDASNALVWGPERLEDAIGTLSDSRGSSHVGFIQSGAGAVATDVETVLRETVSVTQYGAVNDGDGVGGGTNSSSAIQAAINAVVATGKPGTVHIPSGTYRCDTGLVLDLTLCSIEADGAILDFTNMPGGTIADYTAHGFGVALAGVALTITSSYGYAGGAYYEATQRVRGLRIKGKAGASEGSVPPGPPNDQTGLYFYGTTYTQTAALLENIVVSQFYTGALHGANSFGPTVLNSCFVFCSTCVYMPQVSNGGERNNYIASTFYNSDNGLVLDNAFASTFISGCSIGGIHNNYISISQGHLTLDHNHFEGNMAPDYPNAVMLLNDAAAFPSYSVITATGNIFLAKTQRNNPVIKLDGAVMFTMVGGYIDGSTAGSAAVIGGATTSAGSMKISGTWVLNGSNTAIATTMGLYALATIDLADPVTSNNNRIGTYTPTLTSVANVTSTSVPWVCNYQKTYSKVDVWGAVQIDPTTVGTLTKVGISLPLPSNFTLPSDCAGSGGAQDRDQQGVIYPDTTNDRAELGFICTDGTNTTYSFRFSYLLK